MAKNIEMNIKEQSNYDLLYPKSIDENILITEQTQGIYGLSNGATAEDVFKVIPDKIIALGRNVAILNLTF